MAPRSNEGWTDRHSKDVRGAMPDVPAFTPDQQAALWHRIQREPSPRSHLRNWRAVAAGLVGACAIGVAGAAAANVFSAHTGKVAVDAEDLELGGPGERLNPQGADFAAVLDEATDDIGFPSPQSRDSALSWEVEDLSDEEDTLVSAGALRLWTAAHALCAWSDTWAVALRTGDAATRERAVEVILGARDWPAIKDTDAELANQSEAAWLPGLERAVRTDDPVAAKTALAGHGACMPGLAPELGLGERW